MELVLVSPAPVDVPAPAPVVRATVAISDARLALSRVSIEECRARGLPGGYGHARVTFDAAGNASNVRVDGFDSEAPLPQEAVACVRERLGGATVEPFDGSPITVGTGWYLR